MTKVQWEKVLERAHSMTKELGVRPDNPIFLDAIRQLTEPADEVALDADNVAARQVIKDEEIAALKQRLAELEG